MVMEFDWMDSDEASHKRSRHVLKVNVNFVVGAWVASEQLDAARFKSVQGEWWGPRVVASKCRTLYVWQTITFILFNSFLGVIMSFNNDKILQTRNARLSYWPMVVVERVDDPVKGLTVQTVRHVELRHPLRRVSTCPDAERLHHHQPVKVNLRTYRLCYKRRHST